MLQKTADRVASPLVFQIIMLAVTAFMLIPFIHSAYGGYVKYILVFGLLACVWQFIRKNALEIIKDKAGIAALCFALFYCVTILINRGPTFGANIKQLIYMVVFFILLFMLNEKDNEMVIVSAVITAITFVFSALSFVLYVLRIKEWYVLDEKMFVGLGHGTTLWGFYNPNTCGSIAAVSIIASVYLLFVVFRKKKAVKITLSALLVLNIIVQYLVMILSKSRGAFAGMAIAVAAVVFIAFTKNFRREKLSGARRAAIAIALCVVLLAGLAVTAAGIYSNQDKLFAVSAEDSRNRELDTGLENFIEEILKKYTDETSAVKGLMSPRALVTNNFFSASKSLGLDFSGGRLRLWKAGFTVFLQHPLFGCTREGLVESVNAVLGEEGVTSVSGGGLHSIYVTILCSSGIVGFICFAALVVIVLARFAKRLFAKESMSPELLMSFAMSLYFLVSDFVEARILYTVSFFNVAFWIYFGYLNHYAKKEKDTVAEKD